MMGDPAGENEFRKRMERIETLLEAAEHFPDPTIQAQTRELVQGLLDLHGAGLERMLQQLAEIGEAGPAMIVALARDDLVSSLFLLHGLHPLNFETRVRQALDKVRPYLHSQGGDVELLGIADGVVRVRYLENIGDCPTTAATLKSAIDDAICEKAPDAKAIEVEGLPTTNGAARIELALVSR
jgi:Fe-S cluster biogenesis protein NfuA